MLHTQSNLNVALLTRMGKWNALQYEVMHNLVLETTRLSIEVKNLKMLVQSLSGRVDLDQRRARALEAVVQYRPDAVTGAAADGEPADGEGLGGVLEHIVRRRHARAPPPETWPVDGDTRRRCRGGRRSRGSYFAMRTALMPLASE